MIPLIAERDGRTKWSQIQRVLCRLIDSMGFTYVKKSTTQEISGKHDSRFNHFICCQVSTFWHMCAEMWGTSQ